MTSRSRVARRSTQWVDVHISTSIASGVGNLSTLLGQLEDEEVPGLTLVRTIVHLYFLPAFPGTVNGSQLISLGIGVVQIEALAAGAVADPNTATDFPLRNWVFRDQILVQNSLDSLDTPAKELRLELASQRKMYTVDSDLVLSMFNSAFEGSPFVVDVVGLIRQLFKKP